MICKKVVQPIFLSMVCLGMCASAHAQMSSAQLAQPGSVDQAVSGTGMMQTAQAASVAAIPASGWQSDAVTENGNISYCYTEARYNNGLSLVFAHSAMGETNLAIGIPQAGLDIGTIFALTITVDGKLQRQLNGRAMESELLVVPAGQDEALYNALKNGSMLSIEGPMDAAYFALKGTGAAMETIRECAVKGVVPKTQEAAMKPAPVPEEVEIIATAPSTNATTQASKPVPDTAEATVTFPPRPGMKPTPPGVQQEVAAAKTVPVAPVIQMDEPRTTAVLPETLKAILGAAGLEKVQPISLPVSSGTNKIADYAWRQNDFFGGVKEQEVRNGNFTTLVGTYLGQVATRCGGEFSQKMRAVEKLQHLTLRTAEVACENQMGKPDSVASLVFYLTDTGTFSVFFHEAATADAAEAKQAGNNLANVLRKLATSKL